MLSLPMIFFMLSSPSSYMSFIMSMIPVSTKQKNSKVKAVRHRGVSKDEQDRAARIKKRVNRGQKVFGADNKN